MLCAALAPWAIAVICIAVTAVLLAAYALGCYLGFYFIIVKPPVVGADKPNPLMGDEFAEFVKKTQEDAVIMKKLESEPVEVVTRDGLTLRGEFYRAAEPSDVTIVCLHGYNSNAYGDYSTRGLSYLHGGYNVLLANHRHHGMSDGKYIGFGVLDRHDVLKWVEAAEKLVPDGKIFVSGVSMGGATAMQCSCLALTPAVKGIIEDCGYTTVRDEVDYLAKKMFGFVPKLTIRFIEFYMRKLAGYGMREADSREAVKHSKVPILFIHGTNDEFVPTFMGHECYEACTAPKELVLIEGAGHAQSYFKDAEKCEQAVNAFIHKYK